MRDRNARGYKMRQNKQIQNMKHVIQRANLSEDPPKTPPKGHQQNTTKKLPFIDA